MDRIRMVIVDVDAGFIRKMESTLQAHSDIEIVGSANDGLSGAALIEKLHPDVVLFDIVLPGLDGISLLREITAMKKPPMAICCTQFYSSVSVESARNNGASYFLYKPIDYRSVYEIIKGCAIAYKQIQHEKNAVADSSGISALEIRNYLVSLGLPAKLIGCSYLAEAIRLSIKDISLTQNLSKGLYLEIARNMNTTPSCVERCMRNAISAAYHTGRLGERMLTSPSNKEFINYVLRNYQG